MSSFETITCETSAFVSTVWLSRPDRRNAINKQMALELTAFFNQAENDPAIRLVVLRGKGNHFCSGGDLNWMLQGGEMPGHEQPGMILASLFRTLYEFSKPVVAIVHGNAMGGALGLIAASDFVVADELATFCFSEVKLGLAPATISPFVVKRIGEYKSRQWMVSAMPFGAAEAIRMGMIDYTGTKEEVEAYVRNISQLITTNAPEAVKTTKRLTRQVTGKEIDDKISDYTAKMLLQLQGSAEAREGIHAFLEKRKPQWPLSNADNKARSE